MKIVSVPYEYANPLVNKYLNNYTEVCGLFEHNPADQASFDKRYERIIKDYKTDRKRLVGVLKEYNEGLGCGEKTFANLESLSEPDTVVVVTGQQAGVLTGPLYTIYKAVTAIQLAGELTAKTGRKVVPIFWVAAEDHDFAEIDHVDLLNKEQEIVRLKLDYMPEGKCSIGSIPITEAVYRLIDELAESTNPSEWKDEIISVLRQKARGAGNLADWFAAIMSWLFKEQGLIIINPQNKELRKMWSGTFADFLINAETVNEKLELGIRKVREMGFKPQVEKEINNINMFLYLEGERLPLFKNGDQYSVRGKEHKWSLDDLTRIARESPESFSPNVVLRPVAQDALLPIAAYVAGPGEISYYALYREIYPVFGQTMPIIYPRANLTIVERNVSKHMDKYGIRFEEGAEGITRRLNEYLEAQDTVGIENLFDKFRDELTRSFSSLAEAASLIDPALKVQGTETINRLIHHVGNFEQKVRQYHRKSCDKAVKRFRNIDQQLFPRNNLQERVFNIFPYLFKYGPGFVAEVAGTLVISDNQHKLVYISG